MNKIWLYYVSYPVTTAVYFDRALRKSNKISTIGPQLPEELISDWNLQNMKLPILPQNIPTDFNPNLLDFYNNAEEKPNFLIWIESAFGDFPQGIKDLPIPTAGYFIDTHLHLNEHIEQAKNFNYVFIAQREYLQEFQNAGIKNAFWLPLGADTEIHKKKEFAKTHEVGFVGSFFGNPRRMELLERIKEKHNIYYERAFWDEMSNVLGQSKIVFNNAVRNDLNMRLFEVLSIGSFLATDLAKNSGQDELFVNNEDLTIYNDFLINNTISFYLENDELRELIAKRGQELVHNAHLYEHRALEIVEILEGKRNRTSTASELREKSIKNVVISEKRINQKKRSFIIPVIDYAPASKFNIKTLLDDLEQIGGEIIVVFNSEQVASELKNDKRIDQYAIMKNNVGVSRAWNIGLNISRTPISFIINSDVHVEKQTILDLEKALITFPDVAVVGPQGSFFHYNKLQDLQYFDKGTFQNPIEVDAVSGFLFGVLTKHFHNGTLIFENNYTPCYFEEWDLGLQIKKNALHSYIIPTTFYEHEWSGSIRSMRTIKYYDEEQTAQQILENNRLKFIRKWEHLISRDKKLLYLKTSLFVNKILYDSKKLIEENKVNEAEKIFDFLIEFYPNLEVGYLNKALIQKSKGLLTEANINFKKVLEINPQNETALKELSS